jgi:hypothetical protein
VAKREGRVDKLEGRWLSQRHVAKREEQGAKLEGLVLSEGWVAKFRGICGHFRGMGA